MHHSCPEFFYWHWRPLVGDLTDKTWLETVTQIVKCLPVHYGIDKPQIIIEGPKNHTFPPVSAVQMAPYLTLHTWACHNCNMKNHVMHQPSSLLFLSDVTEEFAPQSNRLESKMMDLQASALQSRVITGFLMPTSLPQQPMQLCVRCADTQIRSDHLPIKVWTLSDLIWEVNQICLVCKHSLNVWLAVCTDLGEVKLQRVVCGQGDHEASGQVLWQRVTMVA